jgi:hypothetical protein
MFTITVFLDIRKDFGPWHLGLLYKWPHLNFLASVMKLIRLFLSDRKFRVLVEGELSAPWEI